ncbi:hypothetical protein PF66_02665 [Pseudomonas asplenii]|uniref:Mu-like prophage FluMu protein gp41 n=1 Tax=Pseudomonas asplenii TaxID=53407 RepID=A0A0M9GGV3_9PSED|nr:hypothetical protein [Pseudomonas fuscovaginae]KPA90604.1 hypothetical protein PF66_02665 [Pseudomonas fuscovaginae]
MDDQSNKQWDGLTISGELRIGVYYAGSLHKRFTLRMPVTGDLIAAQELHPNGPLQLVTVEVYRRQLLALGDIPPEHLTTDLLRSSLAEFDLGVIADADEELEKKLMPPSADSPTGGESSTD